MALAAYRHILRSTRIAFQGDAVTLAAARTQARQGFETNRSLESTADAGKQILLAEDVARLLRENVVQGMRDGLNIHTEIERGDNESVKIPSRKMNAAGGATACCQTA